MCISRLVKLCGARRHGFTALELLIGLSLSVCLALAIAPLWLSLQRSGVKEADRTVTLLQGRVAIARLERDLRLAGAGGSHFSVTSPILAATPSQVVFLSHSQPGVPLAVVEWEVAKGCVMRRWGECPAIRPASFTHSLYEDHKTMLEGIDVDSTFAYVLDGMVMEGSVPETELSSIDAVILRVQGTDEGGTWLGAISTRARVGR